MAWKRFLGIKEGDKFTEEFALDNPDGARFYSEEDGLAKDGLYFMG